MTQDEIRRVQERIGTSTDGFWGPKSEKRCREYLKAMMPSPARFPAEGSSAFDSLYGPHGEKNGPAPPTKKIRLPFTVFYEGSAVNSLSPHEECADSLLAVFDRLAAAFPDKATRGAAGILTYDGLYNPRRKRGGSSSWSMHAWAVAIDLDAGRNGNLVHWPTKAKMPLEVMECFAQEGWLAAGAFWSRDAMHFQATRPAV